MVQKYSKVYRTRSFILFTIAHCQAPSWVRFSGAFTKLRKATISFVVPVCLSVRMEQLGFHWKDFHELWKLRIFRKSIEKVQVSLNLDQKNGYYTLGPMPMYDNTSLNSQFDECFRQKLYRISKHTFRFNNSFFYKNLFVYETTWKNMVEPVGLQDENMVHALCMLDI